METINDCSIIYYTANFLEKTNPYFLENTKKQLLQAIGDFPLIIVSQLPTLFGHNSTNVCVGNIGRSHLNIYRQILEGCKVATTKYVAMAEDDILYSWEHFHTQLPHNDTFLFDMNKLSIFTWTRPPLFSFRTNRRVVNQLIAPRQMLIDALEERFKRVKYLMEHDHRTEEDIIRYWGDPGRYEKLLGVTPRDSEEFYSTNPSIVFSHEYAFGYESRGKRKRLGDLRIIEIPFWGTAEKMLQLFDKNYGHNSN
jgi:hypothetical protein